MKLRTTQLPRIMTQREKYAARDWAPHVMRSIGNAVGTAPFKNTNRPNPAYKRKKDKIARRLGFANALHLAAFRTLLAAQFMQKDAD